MKVVCDEGVPRPLVRRLQEMGIDISPPAKGWLGLTNGRLLSAVVTAGFDVLLSNDKNLGFQLNLSKLKIAIVALPSNRRSALLPRSRDIADTIGLASAGKIVTMEADGRRMIRYWSSEGVVLSTSLPSILPFSC